VRYRADPGDGGAVFLLQINVDAPDGQETAALHSLQNFELGGTRMRSESAPHVKRS
jgi:hypothetical protein